MSSLQISRNFCRGFWILHQSGLLGIALTSCHRTPLLLQHRMLTRVKLAFFHAQTRLQGHEICGPLSIYSRDGGGPSDSLPCWKILRQTHSTWLHGTPAPRSDSNSSFNLMLPFSCSLSHPSFPFFVSLDNSLNKPSPWKVFLVFFFFSEKSKPK